jgi:predicted enzyme related to lactoylglutathione lyase
VARNYSVKEEHMGRPVVHFEVIGKDGKKLQDFYSELFDWTIDASNPMAYGIVDNGGQGINGGIGAGEQGRGVTFYVAVEDLQETLDKAEQLGGKTVMPVTEMEGTTIALLQDPEGHTIGVVKPPAEG